jgi:hypothetical protein
MALWYRDTHFFHRGANLNRRNNTVESFVINGSVSLDFSEIREHILQFYKSLYSKQFSWQSELDGLSFDSIGAEEALWLERAFEESEIFEVVKKLK